MLAPGWYKPTLPTAAVGLAVGYFEPLVSIPFALAVGFLLFFHRNPDREPPEDPSLAVSPADGRLAGGRVMHVGPMTDEEMISYIDDPVGISVFMSPLDVHVNRAPYDGRLREVERIRGGFKPAYSDEALGNNRVVLLFEGPGFDFVVRLISGAIARRIVVFIEEGEEVSKGDVISMIRLGSRVDVAFPSEVVEELKVERGDRVKAGETPVARIQQRSLEDK